MGNGTFFCFAKKPPGKRQKNPLKDGFCFHDVPAFSDGVICFLVPWRLFQHKAGWWFQIFFVFIPFWGNDPT